MDISNKQKQTQRYIEQICGFQEGGWWRREGLEFEISRCKLLYIEWINNKVLLYSTGSYIQYPMINHNGKEYDYTETKVTRKNLIWKKMPLLQRCTIWAGVFGLPRWLSSEEPACQCRRCKRCGFNPWIGKIPCTWK